CPEILQGVHEVHFDLTLRPLGGYMAGKTCRAVGEVSESGIGKGCPCTASESRTGNREPGRAGYSPLTGRHLPREEVRRANGIPSSRARHSMDEKRYHLPARRDRRLTLRRWIIIFGIAMAVALGWMWVRRAHDKGVSTSRAALSTAFQPTIPNSAAPPGPAPEGMVWIPGGEFSMGAQDPPGMDHVGMQATEDSRPVHRVYVDGFWMDATDVTNAQFARFVKATGYVTAPDRKPRAEDYPGAPPENLIAGSVVFSPPDHMVPLNDHFQWWSYVPGANWRHPLGPQSDIKDKEN